MKVTSVAIVWIIPGTACAVSYNVGDGGSHVRLIEGSMEGVVHSALAELFCKWRVMRHH